MEVVLRLFVFNRMAALPFFMSLLDIPVSLDDLFQWMESLNDDNENKKSPEECVAEYKICQQRTTDDEVI
jgi:hypothetical protein